MKSARFYTFPAKIRLVAFLAVLLSAGYTEQKMMSGENITQATQVAEQFGQAVVRGDFEAAHVFLTPEAQRVHLPAAMKSEVAEMIAYAKEPLRRVVVVHEVTMTDWPDKQRNDLAWVYVSLEGDSFSEGVSVVLAGTSQGPRVRQLEWGRP